MVQYRALVGEYVLGAAREAARGVPEVATGVQGLVMDVQGLAKVIVLAAQEVANFLVVQLV